VLETYTVSDSHKLNPHSIEVLVWNIYKTDKSDFYSEWERFATGKDLVLIQEAWESSHFLDSLSDIGTSEAIMARSWIDGKRENTATGVMTLSRTHSANARWVRSPGREPFVKTPKMTLISFYNLEGLDEQLMVLNLHALNFTSLSSFKKTLNQLKARIKNHPGPVLFGGDFNTHLNSRFSFMQSYFKELNFKQVRFTPDNRYRILGRYLDFTFVRGLKVLTAQAVKTTGSDHHPMLLKLSLF
tara:strand:+ start:13686 stop:14414 length:729 start_codon:yes stop_codon:yes gene_type:complete